MMGETFHFLRPDWFWALLGLPLLFLLARRRNRSAGGWREACDPELLPHLLHTESGHGINWAAPAVMTGWLGAVLALAGPTWEKLPEVAYHQPTQTVAVLQLTPSMHAHDTAPTRLERARYELQDLLEQSEGTVGLVIFAEEAYGVTPLTDDPKVIGEIVPTLNTSLMPGRGTRTDRGIAEAQQLLENAGARSGRIILLIDGAGDFPERTRIAAKEAAHAGFPVSVLAFGSDADALRPLANAGQGRFSPVLADDRDITSLLLTGRAGPDDFRNLRESGLRADTWKDAGLYFLWIPLLLAPLAFRRGWAGSLALLLLFSTGTPQSAEARVEDWFARPDQQGATAFEAGRLEEAAERFEDPEWRGVAAYRSGQHEEAIATLSAINGPRARYNLGNALAQNGQLQEAMAAYDAVLEIDDDHADALHNRDLVAKLLEQEQEQEQQEPQEDQSSGPSDDSQSEPDDSESSESQPQEEQPNEPGQQQQSESGASENQSQDAQDPGGQTDSNSAQAEQAEAGAEPADSQATAAHQEASEQAGSQSQQTPESAKDQAASERADKRSQPKEFADKAEPEPANAPKEGEWRPSEEETSKKPSSEIAGSNQVPMSEKEQEVEQWLSRVPDDPGGLLREKLRRRYAEKQGAAGQEQGGATWQ